MNHFKTERRAIHETGIVFNEYGWLFREQSIMDLGVDALVETPIDINNQIKIFALQIKGGDKNFHRKKSCLTFYFSERHYLYWNAYSENCPVFIILQDPETNQIYWQYYKEENIKKNSKHWKIDIPLRNILDESAKNDIYNILYEQNDNFTTYNDYIRSSFILKGGNLLAFRYYLNSKEGNCLYLDLIFNERKETINLNYKPKRKEWDTSKSFLEWDNDYYYALMHFEEYVKDQFDSKISLKDFFDRIIPIYKSGIENISEFIFDYINRDNGVPKYKEFKKAFELFSGLDSGKYSVRTLDNLIYFKTSKETYEVNTYAGLTVYLKSFIDRRSYSEIYTETNERIWGDIYIDAGIEKSKFVPVMLNEWEYYWDSLYNRIENEIGRTKHLDNRKEQSLRKLNTFFNLYDDSGNIIELAYDFDDMELYPMAVISMMQIFNAEVCYEEYCEFELDASGQWESISLDDEDWDAPIFHIRPSEM